MTLPELADVFAILAVQMRFSDWDEMQVRGYYEVLKGLDIEFVRAAAQGFAKFSTDANGNAWFPKAPEWYDAAVKIDVDRTRELRSRLRKRTEPLCLACDDTQWERNPDTNQVKKCSCASLRRLEVLGRRPMPALTEGSGRTVPVDVERVAKALADPAQMR